MKKMSTCRALCLMIFHIIPTELPDSMYTLYINKPEDWHCWVTKAQFYTKSETECGWEHVCWIQVFSWVQLGSRTTQGGKWEWEERKGTCSTHTNTCLQMPQHIIKMRLKSPPEISCEGFRTARLIIFTCFSCMHPHFHSFQIHGTEEYRHEGRAMYRVLNSLWEKSGNIWPPIHDRVLR